MLMVLYSHRVYTSYIVCSDVNHWYIGIAKFNTDPLENILAKFGRPDTYNYTNKLEYDEYIASTVMYIMEEIYVYV